MAVTDSERSSKTHRKASTISHYSRKLTIYLLAICVMLLTIFQIQSLHAPPPSLPWNLMHQWQKAINSTANADCTQDLQTMASKLRSSVTFLPLKDLRYSSTAQQGHTWFMSSLYDTQEEGEVQYQKFPSQASKGRILCLKGNDTHDGSWNSYALAWPETLPENATLVKGLTYVSYNHYNYDNIWHGLSAMVPFVAWHIKNQCKVVPRRWILYHWGELRTRMGPWLTTLMEATYGETLNIEKFDWIKDRNDESTTSCFEEVVVMRHNEGGMSRERRIEVYDLLRCKARVYCNVSLKGRIAEVNDKGTPVIRMTMFMRTGARSFKNDSAVIGIFNKACQKVDGCRLMVAYSNNLTFCEQVKLMSSTDILISPHGAQLTNMFFMDRNSSVMEFFPKGWLKLAGVGQYVYRWIASWSGMVHQGAWRDPDGDHCQYPDDDRRCMAVYKGGKIGYNESFFTEWVANVLTEVKIRKEEELVSKKDENGISPSCGCS